jgi:hypothetical protein
VIIGTGEALRSFKADSWRKGVNRNLAGRTARRILGYNTSGRPAYIEFICCQYPVYGQWVGRGE